MSSNPTPYGKPLWCQTCGNYSPEGVMNYHPRCPHCGAEPESTILDKMIELDRSKEIDDK